MGTAALCFTWCSLVAWLVLKKPRRPYSHVRGLGAGFLPRYLSSPWISPPPFLHDLSLFKLFHMTADCQHSDKQKLQGPLRPRFRNHTEYFHCLVFVKASHRFSLNAKKKKRKKKKKEETSPLEGRSRKVTMHSIRDGSLGSVCLWKQLALDCCDGDWWWRLRPTFRHCSGHSSPDTVEPLHSVRMQKQNTETSCRRATSSCCGHLTLVLQLGGPLLAVHFDHLFNHVSWFLKLF